MAKPKNPSFLHIGNSKSRLHTHWSTCIKKYIEKHPKKYPSDLKGLTQICGIEIDFDSVTLYNKFHSFLQKQRKKTDEAFNILIGEGHFNKYIAQGLTEEEIYQKFIDTCVSWGIIPLYYDVDGCYKLIDLHSFLQIKTERLRSTCKEISTKVHTLKEHSRVLPRAIISEMEQLKDSDKVQPMIEARDHLNKLLPSSTETEED